MLYKLVPGGSFEDGARGWTLTGGAKDRAPAASRSAATGSVGSSSLDLPAGASAQSPFTCVNAAYPTFRFFGRNNGLLSTVLVSVVYQSRCSVLVRGAGRDRRPERHLAAALPMLTASAIPGAAVRAAPRRWRCASRRSPAASQIDDVFVDPRMH